MAARPRGIQRTILTRVLAIIVLPLLALGVAGFFVLRELADDTDRSVAESRDRLADEVVGETLTQSAIAIQSELTRYIDERVADARTWATTPTVTAAAAEGASTAATLELIDVSTSALETQFTATRRLPGADAANEYLADEVVRSPFFAEASFTNEYGHVVAASGVTGDFVQSDEDWWQRAWDQGLDIGAVDYIESAGVFSTDVAVRIDDPRTGDPVGVLNAALDVGVLLDVADRHAAAEAVDVTILDDTGRVLADTATSYAPDLVLMGMTTIDPQIALLHASALASSEGHLLGRESVYGYSGTTGGNEDPGWVVVVEQPNEIAFAPIDGIEQVGADVRDSTDRLWVGLAVALVAGFALLAVISTALVRRFVRRFRPMPVAPGREIAADPPAPPAPVPVPSVVAVPAPSPVAVPAAAPSPLPAVVAPGSPSFMEQAVVAMGRRDRTLLQQQSSFVDELQQRTSDTGTRTILDRLDEVSVRLQRNAENLLVLAGEQWPSTDDDPVAVADVVTMGAAVLDDKARISTAALDPVVVVAGAAGDLAHLLAELLDNALTFSPPDTDVEVDGRLTPDGYRVSLTDHGIGIAALGLRTANRRLRQPLDVERSPENRLGLFVIGHLAARHDIDVQLKTAENGLVAEVTLPLELIDAPPMEAAATMPTAEPTTATSVFYVPPTPARPTAPVPDETGPVAAPAAHTPEQAPTPEPIRPSRPSIWPAAFSPVEDAPPSPVQSEPVVGHPD